MSRLKKILLYSAGLVVLGFALILLFISPLAKWMIEKYDVQYVGREITMSGCYVNPFTGHIHLRDVDIKEQSGDSSFLMMKGLTANVSMIKLISGQYEISELVLSEPLGYATYQDSLFNFNDIIERFRGDTLDSLVGEPVHLSLLNIAIENGEFHYVEDETPVNYFIKNVNISSEGLIYNVDTMPIIFSFSSGVGSGDIAGNININLKNLNYGLNINIAKFNLEIINQYLSDITEYGTFRAILDAELHNMGNFATSDSISMTGNLAVTDFHFGRTVQNDFASLESLVISIDRVCPKDFIYRYDSIAVTKPFFRYEHYDYLDNLQTMFGVDGENLTEIDNNTEKFNLVIEIAHLIENLSRNFFRSQYHVGKIAIYDANIEYCDYSLGEEFSISLNPLTAIVDSVDRRNDKIDLLVTSKIQPYGNMRVLLDVNPKDSMSFNMSYYFDHIALTTFNPFLLAYTSFPLDRGTLELNGHWKAHDGILASNNHVLLIDPRVTKKIKSKDNAWIPLPLALAFVREGGNVVDYEIPIEGNLKNPDFKLRDAILDLLKNIFIKPVTTPYRMQVRNTEEELEKSFNIGWAMGSAEILPSQKKFIKKIVRFLKDHHNASIQITPENYTKKEKEYILLNEAKRKYLNASGKEDKSLSRGDSMEISRMSIKDANFVKYLDKHVDDTTLFTTYHKSLKLIDPAVVNRKFDHLQEARKQAFLRIFVDEDVAKQIHFKKEVSTIPFNGFSNYSISYDGEFPDYIVKAFEKMNELDHSPLRDKYSKKRSKYTHREK